ncbi:MAG TPA: hypothetical protein VG326_13510 [Tepidisphaeraceae bacterium]|jgi:hypothetical protein|nr:hypothetical protein [Tepidisphaeraceae bacterium]
MNVLQYVILRHENIAEPHYDLMFETLPGSQLATWRADSWPIERKIAVTRLRDHRRAYLEFEGEIAGHQGRVYQIARGTCEVEVGENAIWSISILTGAPPQVLVIRQIHAENWDAAPGD